MTEELLQAYSLVMAVAGGIFFWAGFIVFGMIARKYNVVFNKSTYYGLMMAAPSGILIYSVLLVFRAAVFTKNSAVNSWIQMFAYISLFISAALCVAAVMKFSRLLDELEKYRGAK
ncbi:MAG: hypothetical protein CVV21_10995 [Candidatus Goldiibacteriota bacterium HGW-Goldbacteria-1]|jgi:hypothetical protein|nr:MAG: hypothetical protein CVV21_10995 [Candidatus Goldiibacteriota bacterium HGW-Goldbacteria-1]